MKVMLITLPNEGEPKDYTTPAHYSIGKLKYIPLGILAVASGIKGDHEIKLLDAASKFLSIEETIAQIREWEPDVLGMTSSIGTAYAMSCVLKRVEGPLKVVGGPFTTHYAQEVLTLGAHAVFIHDGDSNFSDWLDNGCPQGIFEDYIPDLDKLPMPNLDLLDLTEYVIKPKESKKLLLKNLGLRFPMYSSKGCPFKCIFCDVQERRFRWKSPHRVVDEMELYLSKGSASVHIMDDCFNVQKQRVLEICAEIKQRGLNFEWSARGRASIDRKTAETLRDAGCRRLHVGVETFDPEMMRFINKKIDLNEIFNFFKTCREVGIETLGYLIIGFPGETREYRQKLPELIREVGMDLPFFNVLYPLPNTTYYDMLLESGVYKNDFWQEYSLNPVPDFEPELPRSPELQHELLDTVEGYVGQFYGKAA